MRASNSTHLRFLSGADAPRVFEIPSAFEVRRDFFGHIHSHAQASHVFYIQRRTICYLGYESPVLRISAILAGAERMVPIATRK
jgi:hypothetical protein